MGRHHVNCAQAARGVELTVVSDVNPAQGADAPVEFTPDVDEMLGRCDAVILAVPTDRHEELGKRILAAGKHLLVEKPLAATVAACRTLTESAGRSGVTLCVGHVERYNGAWLELAPRVSEPRFLEANRLAAFNPRGTEVDVVLDLMIHDIDLVLRAMGETPVAVDGIGVAVLTERVDIAHARLEFSGGRLANLTASRVSREPVRKLRIFQDDAYFSADFQAQELESAHKDASALGGIRLGKSQASAEHNPLVREIEEFARAVRQEPGAEIIDGDAGERAVAVAAEILESIARRRGAWAGPPA